MAQLHRSHQSPVIRQPGMSSGVGIEVAIAAGAESVATGSRKGRQACPCWQAAAAPARKRPSRSTGGAAKIGYDDGQARPSLSPTVAREENVGSPILNKIL